MNNNDLDFVPDNIEEKSNVVIEDDDDSYNPLESFQNMKLDTEKTSSSVTTMQEIVLYIGMGFGVVLLTITLIVIFKGDKKKNEV